MLRILFTLVISLFSIFSMTFVFAKDHVKPLAADQAFAFSAYVKGKDQLVLKWRIAPGYYLYSDKLEIIPSSFNQIGIGKFEMPSGKAKVDEYNGKYYVHMGILRIFIPLAKPSNGILNLSVHYQGCSADGFCYPPMTKDLKVMLSPTSELKEILISGVAQSGTSNQSYVEHLFDGSSNIVIILSFLGLGILLAFTPCVLPMVPILSGIIVGHKHITTAKAFFLSLEYVLGMAITYAIAGMIVALIGSHVQTLFQMPLAIILGSGLFVLLALSLFGFYDLELPKRWRQRLIKVSNHLKGGTFRGVFWMGVLSSLIVSPCVSAPLVGVLAYIADSGDVVLGGFALLALGFGMGVPLLLVGISAGKLLPKTGAWMEMIKKLFGVIMLGMAIWIISRIIPGPVTLFLCAVLLICTAVFLGVLTESKNNFKKLLRGFGLVLVIYGIILMIGAVMGNSNPLQPWGGSKIMAEQQPNFIIVKNIEQLDKELLIASKKHKKVMLDFSAAWCVSCMMMDRQVFSMPAVQDQLEKYTLLRADVTDNNAFDQALLKRFNVVAPPTILFFNQSGHEMIKERIVGEVSAKEFLAHLAEVAETKGISNAK